MIDPTLKEARRIRQNIYARLHRLQRKVSGGCNESCIKIIKVMTELNIKLSAIGYRITDENELKSGRLVKITNDWIQEKKNKETCLQKLARRARNGTHEDVANFVREMARSYKDAK